MDRTLLPTLAVMLAAATPVGAQVGPSAGIAAPAGGSLSFSKSEAILGGSPSRLAALVAQQNGAPLVSAALPVTPSSYSSLPQVRQQSLFQRAVATDRPNVFGTVALPVARTPLDRRWRRVQAQRANGAAAAFAELLRGREALERVDAVNRFVNARVAFVDDSRQYRSPDVWQSASDTLRKGRGDCEDYAIAKLQLLRAAGFAERDLYLVIVRDLVRQADHAVLVVRSEDRMLMLDNGTDRLGDATAMQDYRPMLSYSAGRAWAHGYQRPTVTFASSALAQQAPVAPAAAPLEPIESAELEIAQRSVSASLLALSTGFSR